MKSLLVHTMMVTYKAMGKQSNNILGSKLSKTNDTNSFSKPYRRMS